MTWRSPEDINRNRRDLWRAGILWGLVVVLVSVALAVQAGVRQASHVAMGDPIDLGPLVVQVPEGWRVVPDPRGLRVIARSPDRQPLVLQIAVERPPMALLSATEYMQLRLQAPEAESPRRLEIAGRPGVMTTVFGTVAATPMPASKTLAVAPLDEEQFLVVELTRMGDYSAGDQVLVRQIAERIRLED